jgi:hypothetical protein
MSNRNMTLCYLLTLCIVTLASGLLLHIISLPFVTKDNNPNSFWLDIAIAFLFIFITYNAYLFVFHFLLTNYTYSVFKRGVCCFVFANLLWIIPLTLLAGFDLQGILIVTFSIGICSFGIPYLYDYLNQKLASQSNGI